jgi:hypothetical protein
MKLLKKKTSELSKLKGKREYTVEAISQHCLLLTTSLPLTALASLYLDYESFFQDIIFSR